MIIDLRFYSKLLMRRLPAMLIIVLICTGIGAVVSTRLPTTYSTSATLLVEQSQIPDRMVGVDLGLGANQQLELVQRSLMTRANLLDVARETKIFPNIAQMSPDEIVQAMRENTRIGRARGRNASAAMTISFEGANPQRVAEVVNQYVTIVLATSSDVRTSRAQGTLDFFEQEVQRLSEELDLRSQKIVEFKNDNANALPENFDFRLNRQSLLQERLSRAERDLEALTLQRKNVVRIYEATGSIRPSSGVALTPEQQQLQGLERELSTALTVYSEENPKVRLLRSRVTALRDLIENQGAEGGQEAGGAEEVQANTALEISLAEIDARITTLNQDIEAIQTELDTLQETIDRTPLNRIRLQAMEREIENTRQIHSSAVQRLNQARMGERVEVSAKGERITLLEPASIPDIPSSPNRAAIVGGGAAIGLALAAGLFALLELLTQSIRRPSEIEKKLQITPLVTLPLIETPSHRRVRRAKKLALIIAVCVILVGGIWAVDTYYMRLDLLLEKVISRLA